MTDLVDAWKRIESKAWFPLIAKHKQNKDSEYHLFVKECMDKLPYVLLITDCCEVWFRISYRPQFEKEVQQCIPGTILSTQSEALILKLLQDNLWQFNQTSERKVDNRCEQSNWAVIEITENSLLLSFDMNIADVTLSWTFDCCKLETGKGAILSELLVFPLFRMVNIMQEETAMLIDIICRKDREIAEYKEYYGKISRISVITEPFDIQQFERNILNQVTKHSNENIWQFSKGWTLFLQQLFSVCVQLQQNEASKNELSLFMSSPEDTSCSNQKSVEQPLGDSSGKKTISQSETSAKVKRQPGIDEPSCSANIEEHRRENQIRRKVLETLSLEDKKQSDQKRKKKRLV